MHTSDVTVIRGGRLLDPATGTDRSGHLVIEGGRIKALADTVPSGAHIIPAEDHLVVPGLIDLHVHLREPGQEHKEDIASGTASAVAGGFTTVACMPNTDPPIDTPEMIEFVKNRVLEAGHCRVYPVAALTRHRAGSELVNFSVLQRAGAVAFSDDGDGLNDDQLMAQAFAALAEIGSIAIQHCEDGRYPRGFMHQGTVSRELGIAGMDPRAEEAMIERDLELAATIQARYHVAHISTARAVELVRRAKAANIRVTTEVCPHHLLLTDESCRSLDPNFKMHPPLRTEHDVQACIAGVVDGTIDILVTDHAPHSPAEKALPFAEAPAGIIGLETALPLFVKALVEPGHIGWIRLIELMSTAPAALLELPGGTLAPTAPADVTIIDPEWTWTIEPAQFSSKARNCPFAGQQVRGRVVATLVGGQQVYGRAP